MRNRGKTLALSAGVGLLTGVRSMAGLALLTRQFSSDAHAPHVGSAASLLRSRGVSRLAATLAASEMAADKLPFMPNRVEPSSLLGRGAFGGLAGFLVADYMGGPRLSATAIGAVSAVASTFLSYHLRLSATKRTGMPDWSVALLEDSLVLTTGRQLSTHLDE